MTTYVFGAGASRDAGYPLAKSMGSDLFAWMEQHDAEGIFDFRLAAASLREKFIDVEDIERLLTEIDELLDQAAKSSPELRAVAAGIANHDKPALVRALQRWFEEIREKKSESYELFAKQVVRAGDVIISFNYDVSLDRELKLAGRWQLGDGYGFKVEDFAQGSAVKLLKLHGSINWLAPIFGGKVTGGGRIFQRGNVFGPRPIFNNLELTFLDYNDAVDARFPRGGAVGVPPLILPTRCKKFYFDSNLGPEFGEFWDDLWDSATEALRQSNRVVICGYSIPLVDERACELLFEVVPLNAHVEVCCGSETEGVVQRFRGTVTRYDRANRVTFQIG